MANSNRPAGLSPVGYLNGAPWTGGGRVYYIASNDTNALAIGDPVRSSGSGDTNGIAGVTLATAGTAMRGVIAGIGTAPPGSGYFNPSNLNTTVAPATKTVAYYALIIDDPNVIFEVQEIGTGTALTADEIGLNCNLVAGTNNGYVSGWLLTNTTEATTASLDVKLLGLSQKRDNAFGAYAKWRVLINSHELRGGVLGI